MERKKEGRREEGKTEDTTTNIKDIFKIYKLIK